MQCLNHHSPPNSLLKFMYCFLNSNVHKPWGDPLRSEENMSLIQIVQVHAKPQLPVTIRSFHKPVLVAGAQHSVMFYLTESEQVSKLETSQTTKHFYSDRQPFPECYFRYLQILIAFRKVFFFFFLTWCGNPTLNISLLMLLYCYKYQEITGSCTWKIEL